MYRAVLPEYLDLNELLLQVSASILSEVQRAEVAPLYTGRADRNNRGGAEAVGLQAGHIRGFENVARLAHPLPFPLSVGG